MNIRQKELGFLPAVKCREVEEVLQVVRKNGEESKARAYTGFSRRSSKNDKVFEYFVSLARRRLKAMPGSLRTNIERILREEGSSLYGLLQA